MVHTAIERFLCFLQNTVKGPLIDYPKYPNKLQVSALIVFFKSYPFLPSSPIFWNSKKRGLAHQPSKIKKVQFISWIFLFEFLVGVILPCILLSQEFSSNKSTNGRKMGMKKSTFQILYIGTITSIGYASFMWISEADEITYDYTVVGKFTNYLDRVLTWENPKKINLKRKIDIMGIATQLNCQGFVICAYFAPTMCLYFKMDPMWPTLQRIFPSCIYDDIYVTNDLSCQIWFYGIRPGLIYGWMTSTCRTMGGSIFFAWIFFEMFNQCTVKLHALRPELGIHLYWAYWKIFAGPKYWARAGLAVGIYGGIWLVTICLYATIRVIPNAKPLTFVYMTFPLTAIIAILAFVCLPYALGFPSASRSLINKWRYYSGINGGCFKGKVMRRQVRAMQPTNIRVGQFFNLDKSIVVLVTTAIVDETVNLIMSLSNI